MFKKNLKEKKISFKIDTERFESIHDYAVREIVRRCCFVARRDVTAHRGSCRTRGCKLTPLRYAFDPRNRYIKIHSSHW